MQNFYRRDCWDLARLQRSCHDVCWILNLSEISSISPRLLRTRQDCRDCAEIVKMLPWCSWHSKSRRDCGEISSILPRLPRSCHDVCEFLNLGEISAISPWYLLVSQISSSSRQDSLHLAKIGEISLWSSTLAVSCQDFERHKLLTEIAKKKKKNITQSFSDGMNNFPPWI